MSEQMNGTELPKDVDKHKSRQLDDGDWGDIVVIKPHGAYILFNCDPTLENLQSLVGGYIEVIPGFTKFGNMSCIVLGDEEGKLKGYPVNNRATIEWSRCINCSPDMLVGDIVVLTGAAKTHFERD